MKIASPKKNQSVESVQVVKESCLTTLIFDPGITFGQDYLKALNVSDLMGASMSSSEEQDNLKASEL